MSSVAAVATLESVGVCTSSLVEEHVPVQETCADIILEREEGAPPNKKQTDGPSTIALCMQWSLSKNEIDH